MAMMTFTASVLAQQADQDDNEQKLQRIDDLAVQIDEDAMILVENEQEFEVEMEEARVRLEEAAREIAELTSEMVVPFMDDFIDGVHMGHRRAMLGINIGGVSDDGPSNGVAIRGVTPDGPADEAGLKTGDVLVSINGEPLSADTSGKSLNKLLSAMGDVDAGDVVSVQYDRDGSTLNADIVADLLEPGVFTFALGDDDEFKFSMNNQMPNIHVRPFGEGPFTWHLARHWGRMELVDLTPELGKYFGTDEGVVVVRAPKNEALQLKDGDVILNIDKREPESPEHALRILRSYSPGESLEIQVMRHKRRRTLEISVPDRSDEAAIRPDITLRPSMHERRVIRLRKPPTET
jgi:type II secretory pathway component PulC